MDTLLLMLICGACYLIAYHTYGKFLAKKIFKLRKDAPVPSVELQDGIDYVPAQRGMVFGHHYTSIAGGDSASAIKNLGLVESQVLQ